MLSYDKMELYTYTNDGIEEGKHAVTTQGLKTFKNDSPF